MANEITWEIPKVDSQEVIEKLKGTTLRVDQTIFKMQTAVNRLAIKKAKQNFTSRFSTKPQNKYVLQGDLKKLSTNFKTMKNPNVKGGTQIKNLSYYAKFLEFSAEIHAKKGKYLTFKINGEWKKVESVSLPAKPFLGPAVKEVWNSAEAKRVQEQVLQKALDAYWKKQGTN